MPSQNPIKILAMIPARLGSKRIPKKNLRYFGDKPLLAHAITLAKNSNLFDEVYVNSAVSYTHLTLPTTPYV